MMKVKIYSNNQLLITCKSIDINPIAFGTAREFTFNDIRIPPKQSDFLQQINDPNFSFYGTELKVGIGMHDKFKRWFTFYNGIFNVIDYGICSKREWSVKCFVSGEEGVEYRQGLVDTFTLWSKKEDIVWNNLTEKSPTKEDYIYGCFLYSGLSSGLLERENYKFNMALIKEETDFLYYAGQEFIGDRGYFGNSIYTFKDCLLIAFHNKVLLTGRRVVFSNVGSISGKEVIELYLEIKLIFQQFGFIVEELF